MTCLDQAMRSESCRHTVHDDSRGPGEIGAAIRLARIDAQVRDYCAATLAARLEKALRAMEAGDLDRARALVNSTIQDLGGKQHV